MHILRRAALLLLLTCPLAAAAERRTADVPAGDIHEECMNLEPGDTLSYAYRSDVPLEFNIHYHEGEVVHFPARESASALRSGRFVADTAQHYCMMWSNAGPRAAALDVEFELKARP
jgi:hypothetical protein